MRLVRCAFLQTAQYESPSARIASLMLVNLARRRINGASRLSCHSSLHAMCNDILVGAAVPSRATLSCLRVEAIETGHRDCAYTPRLPSLTSDLSPWRDGPVLQAVDARQLFDRI